MSFNCTTEEITFDISFMEYGMNMAGLNIFRTRRKHLLEQLLFSDCLFSGLASLQNTFFQNF